MSQWTPVLKGHKGGQSWFSAMCSHKLSVSCPNTWKLRIEGVSLHNVLHRSYTQCETQEKQGRKILKAEVYSIPKTHSDVWLGSESASENNHLHWTIYTIQNFWFSGAFKGNSRELTHLNENVRRSQSPSI